MDVTDYAGMIAALTGVEIDVLVCGAKVKSAGFLGDITEKDAYDAVSTNVLGVMYTVRAALPGMKARSQNHPSSIVLIGCFTSMVSTDLPVCQVEQLIATLPMHACPWILCT